MYQQGSRRLLTLTVVALIAICVTPSLLWAQVSQGRVNITVLDPHSAVIVGADLTLTDVATNDTRKGATQDAGTYSFVGLSFGEYRLTVAKDGFVSQTLSVVVQSARDTDVKATLKVGSTSEVVNVEGVAQVIESTTNAINITIDTKQIEDLPMNDRNIQTGFATLSAGYNGAYNGLPIMAQGNTMDGILANTGRWKYGTTGTIGAGVTPRLENVAEMTISTDQLDMNQGWGTSSMHMTFVTRRGTNNWHGRFFEDHRNSALNAYGWGSTQKSKYHRNEFGASIGGPVLKDKLFFFFNWSQYKQPGGSAVTRQYFNDASRTGVFSYGSGVTVNLFSLMNTYNAANKTSFPTTLNSLVAARITQIDKYRTSSGAPVAASQAPSDPNVNAWLFQNTSPDNRYFPTFRMDYNISQSQRLNFAYNQTKTRNPHTNADHWPGDGRGADNYSNGFTSALGYEWTITPHLVNQFKLGYMYTASWFGMNGSTEFRNPGVTEIWYGYAGGTGNGNLDDWYELPNSRMQPVFSLSDNVSWAKGAHMFSFGANAYRDSNKYWDPEEGYVQVSLGLDAQDPASNVLSKAAIQSASTNPSKTMTDTEWANAKQLYATLTGRIGSGGYYGRHALNPGTGDFYSNVGHNILNELQKSWGVFFQDSWKMKPNLTLNYGLRWDFVNPDQDLTKKYMTLSNQDIWGPTKMGAIFQPGTLGGTMNPNWVTTPQAYEGWKVTPQPGIGIAWTPRSNGSLIEKLMGGEKTVVRTAYSIRRFTEPQQFIWDFGTNYGTGFYQRFYSYPGTTNGNGFFVAGSLKLGDPIPTSTFTYTPPTYSNTIPVSASTFGSLTVNSIQEGIRQPYTQSWNFGIQRDLGASRALEVRYNGNRTIHQWIAPNINEYNIFENGFLTEFKQAQTNYNINHAAGVESFANSGKSGQGNTPVLTAAGILGTNSTYLNFIKNGQAGSAAREIQRTKAAFCKLVGSSFSPCGTSYGSGAGYPINYFVANPFAVPASAQILTDSGYSNYHALQVEFRQRSWHGLNATANYTWSKTMGLGATDWYAASTILTLRNLRSSYQPLMGDRNHVVHVNATFDLPIGKGKTFLNRGGIVDKALGGWTVSSIITIQSGSAFRIGGNNNTVNYNIDSGVALNGVTAKDIQSHIGHFFDSTGRPYFLDPNWVNSIKANNNIVAASTPGEWGTMLWLHGPHQSYTDLGISKAASITEHLRFKFQTELLNAFNHPTFGQNTTGITSTTFGLGSQTASSRRIEFRANLEF